MERTPVPADTKRKVLVEAGHRCAIPTCRATTTEVAHIVPWAESADNTFENLIALCPNCHTRYDQKREIDRLSMRMYKQNLALVNYRYGDVERRLFEHFAESDAQYAALGVGADILVRNAVKDGLIERVPVEFGTYDLNRSDGFKQSLPTTNVYALTAAGLVFVERLKQGRDLSDLG